MVIEFPVATYYAAKKREGSRSDREIRDEELILLMDALDMALWSRADRLNMALVHHGDRGVQYTSIRYGQRLADSGIERSVGRKGPE